MRPARHPAQRGETRTNPKYSPQGRCRGRSDTQRSAIIAGEMVAKLAPDRVVMLRLAIAAQENSITVLSFQLYIISSRLAAFRITAATGGIHETYGLMINERL